MYPSDVSLTARAVKKQPPKGNPWAPCSIPTLALAPSPRTLLEPLLLPLPLLAAPQLPVFGRHHKTNCSNSRDATREWQLGRTGWVPFFRRLTSSGLSVRTCSGKGKGIADTPGREHPTTPGPLCCKRQLLSAVLVSRAEMEACNRLEDL